MAISRDRKALCISSCKAEEEDLQHHSNKQQYPLLGAGRETDPQNHAVDEYVQFHQN
jgi:hypothetical protein